jgi:hypothetical protein
MAVDSASMFIVVSLDTHQGGVHDVLTRDIWWSTMGNTREAHQEAVALFCTRYPAVKKVPCVASTIRALREVNFEAELLRHVIEGRTFYSSGPFFLGRAFLNFVR